MSCDRSKMKTAVPPRHRSASNHSIHLPFLAVPALENLPQPNTKMFLSRLPILPARLPNSLVRLSPALRSVQLGSHMTQDPEVWEKEKKKTLEGKVDRHMKGAPGWNEKLASVSEAAVGVSREVISTPFGHACLTPLEPPHFYRSKPTGFVLLRLYHYHVYLSVDNGMELTLLLAQEPIEDMKTLQDETVADIQNADDSGLEYPAGDISNRDQMRPDLCGESPVPKYVTDKEKEGSGR